MIKAVVLDIGSVLEVIDPGVFPAPFESRHRLAPGSVVAAADFAGDPGLGELTEAEVRAHWRQRLGLSDAQAEELMADYWRWYLGVLDQPLVDWFAAVRGRGLRAGILSNSGPGAREVERVWGFEAMTDDIVYSHEVGVAKPDPAVFELTASRLGVAPGEIVFPGRRRDQRRGGPRGRLARRTPPGDRSLHRRAGADHRRRVVTGAGAKVS